MFASLKLGLVSNPTEFPLVLVPSESSLDPGFFKLTVSLASRILSRAESSGLFLRGMTGFLAQACQHAGAPLSLVA